MGQWSIRKLMFLIAGIAVVLGGFIGVDRMFPAREGCGRRTQCASNLRNVVLGALAYANDRGHFPTGTWPNLRLPPEERLSWYAATQPYLEDRESWESLDRGQAWNSPANTPVADARQGLLRCPDSVTPAGGPMPTPYIGIAGLGTDAPSLPAGHPRGGVFGYDRRTALKDITDGASNTMMVAESGRVWGSWLAGGPATVRGLDTADLPYIGPARQFGGLHPPAGANVAFADGAVRFVGGTINPRLFEAFSTIAGGEKLPQDAVDQ